MYESLVQGDHVMSVILSHLFPHTPLTENLFGFFSLAGGSIAAWAVVVGALVLWEERKDKSFVFYFFASFATVGFLVHFVIKWLFMRERPYVSADFPSTVCPTDYSFPSGHAALSFAAAVILGHFDRKRKPLYYLTAVIISYSRIFLFCHYLSDVVAGALLGSSVSAVFLFIHFLKNRNKPDKRNR